ncbi:MAG: hypothetical protein IKF64_02620 [Eubacterium sp.]|nr:hypothetical protein [Eubacterium sp.]
MKKSVKIICVCMAALIFALAPAFAFAENSQPKATPVLTSISFKNAVIEEKFEPYKHDYTLTLSDSKVTPTLEDYSIDGEADIFVTYDYDNAKHQTGALVTIQYESGSAIYTFKYKNAEFFKESSNNYLKEVKCKSGIVYPEITRDRTEYTIYIPNDLTVLEMSAATEDIGAYCDVPSEISLTSEQELDIPLVVTASNGEKRVYAFDMKRTEKTSEEFETMIKNGTEKELVDSEKLYTNPAFLIAVLSAAGSVLLIILLVRLVKRLTVEVGDGDETEFFD